jgi:transcriptional regulator with XRE-family HTH domain
METGGLGDYLKERRLLAGFSLREVERKTGNEVSNAYLSQLESSKVSNPSPRVLARLAEVYKVTIEEMMIEAGFIKHTEPKQKRAGIATLVGHDITNEERKELLRYLQFLRTQRNRTVHEKG